MTTNIENKYYNFAESATLYEDNDIPKPPLEVFCKKGALEKNKYYQFSQVKSAARSLRNTHREVQVCDPVQY